MDVNKIKVGKIYPYTSRTTPASAGALGKVIAVETKATGAWVTLHDKERAKQLTVRPSQVG